MRKGILLNFLTIILLVFLNPSNSFAETKFSDISDTFWAKEPIEQLSSMGIINGYPDGTFKPNEKLTRVHVAIMLQKAKEFDTDNRPNPNLQDVTENDNYYRIIATVMDEGIFDGIVDNNQFEPYKSVTRAEMAVILLNTYDNLQNANTINSSFEDVPRDYWAYKEINSLVELGIVKGYPNGTFRPENELTRGQFAVMLTKTLNYNLDGLFINGTESSIEPFEKDGKMYVPLEEVIKGMGDQYDYHHSARTAFIQKNDGEDIMLTNGKSVAIVGYKFVPLATKEVNDVEVPTGHRAIMINEVIYVPVDFMENVMNYPVNVDGDNVYIGKMPEKKEEPKPSNDSKQEEKPSNDNKQETKPEPKPDKDKEKEQPKEEPKDNDSGSSGTVDREAVVDMLVDKWNYAKIGETSASLNVYNPGGQHGGHVILDMNNPNNIYLQIKAWTVPEQPETSTIAPSVKDAINQILKSDGNKIYNIVSSLAEKGNYNGQSQVNASANGYNVQAFFTGSAVKVHIKK